ncbi:hypothetical protein LTR86_003896 [Recurvomyces mirabilis]|nr:hypothetical protein LTR86_003896 [Recurvomyces mirabilis]
MIAEVEEHDGVIGDGEKDAHELEAFLPLEPRPELVPGQAKSKALTINSCLAIVVNIGSAVGLVFVNKLIFSDTNLRHAQVTFAAIHFAITALALYTVSLPPLHLFERKALGVLKILPLAVAMIAAVVLTNASLAYSSIHFYQVARVLVTPIVAGMEFIILKKRIPVLAAVTLIPVCAGVGLVSYFDTAAAADVDGVSTDGSRTSLLGIFFALISLVASATYTVMIKKYHETTGCGSAQLLLNQSPLSVLVMLYIIPISDDITVWRSVGVSIWAIILLSGFLACGLHITQFQIVDGPGPVASTVVGHAKTCLIIAIGWIHSRRSLQDGSMVGILLALGGIIAYSIVTMRASR